MKLAEALQERAFYNRRIEEIRQRLLNNVVVQEGEKPAEDPISLMNELQQCIDTLNALIVKINLTNSNTVVDGVTITELIANRDCLSISISAYRDIVHEASSLSHRVARSEIKVLSVVDVKQLQKKSDDMAKQLRLLDNRIQQLNWPVDIIE